MTEPFDDQVWTGLARRMSAVEAYIPETRPWRPVEATLAAVSVRVRRGPAFGPGHAQRPAASLVWALAVIGLIVALLIATLLAGGVVHRDSSPDRGGRNGLIAYDTTDLATTTSFPGPYIYLSDSSARDPRLYDAGASDVERCPTFSPDGTRLAYVGSGNVLRVGSLDHSTVRQYDSMVVGFLGGYASRRFVWSPDGARIAFLEDTQAMNGSGVPNKIGLLSVLDGSLATIELSPVETLADIAWAPDGDRIAALGYGGNTAAERNQTSIFILGADGSDVHRIAQFSSGVMPPIQLSWSPDGTHLTYTRWAVGPALTNDVFVIGADGSADTDLTRSPADDAAAIWSPDGRRIAYATTDPSGPVVVTVDPDGSHPTVVDRGRSVSGLVWSPDSTHLLVVPAYDGTRAAGPQDETVLVSTDGTLSSVPVVASPLSCLPSWQRLAP